MAITTTTQVAAPVNVIFQARLLRNAKALAPYFVGTDPAEIMAHQSTFTAKWRRIENLTPTTTALSELTGSLAFPTRSAVQPSVTDLTATVSKYGNFIYLNEEVDLVNTNSHADKYAEILGINAGQSLNRLQRNVVEDGATAIFAATATTATGVGIGQAVHGLSRADIAVAVNAVNRQDALKFTPMTLGNTNIGTTPLRASFWGICHVDTEEDIRALTGFNAVETYGNQTQIESGEFGHVGGVRFISTTEASIDADSGATLTGSATIAGRSTSLTSYDVYNTVIFGMDAIGSLGFGFEHVQSVYTVGDRLPGVLMISHPKGSAGSADPLNEMASLGWKSWHAGLVKNSNWVRVIRHTTARLEAG